MSSALSRDRRAAALVTVIGAVIAVATLVPASSSRVSAALNTVTIIDDTASIAVDVPLEWTDVTTAPDTTVDGDPQPRIIAAPDQERFYDSFETPGAVYTLAPYRADTARAVTRTYDFSGRCLDVGVSRYSDAYFVGSMQSWTSCDGGTASVVTLFVNPPDNSFSASLLIQVPTAADEEALTTILTTFHVTDQVEVAEGTGAAAVDPAVPVVTGAPVATEAPVPAAPAPPGAGAAWPLSTVVVDDTGTLYVAVPVDWTATVTAPVSDDVGKGRPAIVAAPDLQRYAAGTGIGTYLLAEPATVDLPAVMARIAPSGCMGGPVTPYADPAFSGFTQAFTGCGGGHLVVTFAVNLIGRTHHTLSGRITVDPDEARTVGLVLGTFNFTKSGATPR